MSSVIRLIPCRVFAFIVVLVTLTFVSGKAVASAETTPQSRSCVSLLNNGNFASGATAWTTHSANISAGQATLGPSYGGIEQAVPGSYPVGSNVTLEVDYSISGPLSGARFQLHFTDSVNNNISKSYTPGTTSGTFSQSSLVPAAGDPANSAYNGNTVSLRVYLEGKDGATVTVNEVRLLSGNCGNSAEFPTIEVANISGVSGYQIGIFGSNFGSNSGARGVTILGAPAQIDEWTDSFVRVTIPTVSPGNNANGLVLTSSGGNSTTSPFTVYTIDSSWLTLPQGSFTNIAHGKPVTLSGIDAANSWCWDGESAQMVSAYDFLTDFVCDNAFGAKFSADSSLGTESTITIDSGSIQSPGDYLFQFFNKADWTRVDYGNCWGTGYPYAYVIEASPDGLPGSWATALASESANLRGNRSHYFTLPPGKRYLRIRVTDSASDCNSAIAGRDFEMKEVRLYRVSGGHGQTVDGFTIYGDSLTAGAFNQIFGASDIGPRVDGLFPSNFPFTPLGFPGMKASGLDLDYADPNELEDTWNEDDLAASAHYWGIALGTNDINLAGVNDWGFYEPWSQFNQYDENVDSAINWLIARGHVPILARMPDTNEAAGGYGFIEAKKKILNDIDTLAAQYRLIPGPDLYTEFRLNIDRDGASWMWSDGTHHNYAGSDAWVGLWADSLEKVIAIRSTTPTAVTLSHQAEEVNWDFEIAVVLFKVLSVLLIVLWRNRGNRLALKGYGSAESDKSVIR